MSEKFYKCIADGGRVRTKQLGNGRYLHLCFLKGKSYAGEVRVNKKTKK